MARPRPDRQFTFAIVSGTGQVLWTSGAVTLAVTNGLYATALGLPPTTGQALVFGGTRWVARTATST